MSSGKRSIQVAIKVRPLLKKEKDQKSVWRVVENSIQLADSQAEPFYFDHIFDYDASNQAIFDKVAKPIVHSAIEGFNGTIFAYGQTSSGKTYTMMGDEENPGVMVLAAKEIFRQIEITTERQFLLRIGYIEIYNEKIYDLLNKKNQDLKIHETSNGLVSVNCEESIITCEEDFLHHLTQGTKERTVGETNMNERSSRSHAIFRVIIESRKMDRSEDDSVTQSVLNLVDLAGSERADQTGARGNRLKEGGHINKSLLFLSNVIKRLSEDEDHKYISYRDSKLTRILQASLGGNALTSIICNIKPTAIEESQSTLNFASRAKIIKTKPQVNETVSDATMMKRLEREIKMLKTRLEEEQRKNESQIKVRQLEQRIRNEDLKIISCNSLHSGKNREKRRRTWCPSSTNHDSSSAHLPSALPVNYLPSRLQPPKSSYYLTPLITMKPSEPPTTKSIGGLPVPEDPLPEIDEEFAPSDMVNFEMLSPLQTPKLRTKLECRVSITPKVTQNQKKLLEVVEHDLMELQEFTNLENRADIQHDTERALKQIVESLTNRNSVLEKERLEYLEFKNDIDLTRERLNEHEKRCDELQIQVTKLTSTNKVANEKITKYEHDLAELRAANEKLAMENREAVNLEFEFERHKNKSKLRENELLELLSDKDKEILKFEKSLKALNDENLQNSKEELLQLSQSEIKVDADGKVCVKCEDLQRLLEENRKVTKDFENLTLEYQQLKLNFQEIKIENESSKAKVVELEELQKSESIEREKLCKELSEFKTKLSDIQKAYEEVNLECSAKNDECVALNQQIEKAQKEMLLLQDKYNALELSWQKQQQMLKDIESQYAAIEIKYQNLQTEYKQLECTKGEYLTDCERLHKENVELQTQIDDLKLKVQNVQQQLLENAEKQGSLHDATCQTIGEASSDVQKEHDQLKQQISELQTQFEDLQKEYDDLSNQLMDNLQESETLREQNTKLVQKLQDFEEKCAEVSKAETEMSDLKSQLEKLMTSERKSLLNMPSPCRNSSMRSSGVCIEEEEFEECNDSDNLLKKFCELSECLTQIELEHHDGKRKVFKTPTTATTPNYKLCLRNISGVSRAQKDFVEEMENIHLHGSFKQHSFHIVEVNQSADNLEVTSPAAEEKESDKCENCCQFIDKLKKQISNLEALNAEERQGNKALLENTERTLSEMREQIMQLSAELLEKSTFVENCACKTYQRQIETLEKEKADITIVCEELQEKVANFTIDGSLMNFTISGDVAKSSKVDDLNQEIETIRYKHSELQKTYESQTKMLEDLTQRNLDLESDLKMAHDELDVQGKNFNEKLNQLQLEMLEKLEISAEKHRDNMKKYNNEWLQGKEAYERTIQELQSELEVLKEANQKECQSGNDTAQQQLDTTQEDFDENKDAISDLIESPKTDKSTEQLIGEKTKEFENLKEEFDQLQDTHAKLLDERMQSSKELEKLIEKECQLVNENEVLNSDIADLKSNHKQISDKYNSLLLEKETLFEEKVNLHQKLCALEENLKNNIELQEHIDKLKTEKEQLLMEMKQIQNKLESAETRIEEFCAEDATREDMIKSLQMKVDSIDLIEKTNSNLNENLEKLQTELADAHNQLETLTAEKNCIEAKLIQLTEADETQKKEAEIQVMQKEKETLENKLKEYENLHEQKALLEDQLKSLEGVTQENQLLEQKLQDFEVLQKAVNDLEEQSHQYQKALEDKIKQFEQLDSQKANLEDQLKSLDSIVAENSLMEQKLKDLETLQVNYKALEAQILMLEGVSEEKLGTEAKLNEISKACEEHIKDLESLRRHNLVLEEEINKEKTASIENLKQVTTLAHERDVLYSQLQEKLKQLEEIQQDKLNIEGQLQEAAKQMQILREEKTAIETELQQKSAESESNKSELEDLREKMAALQNDMQQSLETLDDFKNKEIVSLKEIESLKESVATLTNSSASLELEKCNLDKQLQQCNEDLRLLRQQNETLETQITLLTADKQSFAEQCSQLQEDKSTLQEQLSCLKEKAKKEDLLEQIIKEKAQLSHNLRLVSEKYQSSQDAMLGITKDCEKSKRDVEMLKCSLLSSNREKQQLEVKMEEYKKLADEKCKLDEALCSLKSLHDDTLKALQREKEDTQKNQAKYEHEVTLFKQREETLSQKLESVQQNLHEMLTKANAYDKLLIDHEEIEKALSAAEKQNKELLNEITELKSSISSSSQAHEEIIRTQTAKIQQLEVDLQKSTQQEKELRTKSVEFEEQIRGEKNSLERQLNEVRGYLAELQLKYHSLQATNIKLEEQNKSLQQQIQNTSQQLKDTTSLNLELRDLKQKYSELEEKMKATIDEASRCSHVMREEVQHQKKLLEQQLEAYIVLRMDLNSKEDAFAVEKEQLTSTINTLQTENSSLLEKIREITVNNFKHEIQIQSADVSVNTSMEGAANTSSSSTHSRRSGESIKIRAEEKLCSKSTRGTPHSVERKNRRSNTFDERRSSYWGATHDKETMTIPVDTNCNCEELDRKLKECEKKLFIRESQVTALNMELKNHPLKDQNAALMKRLQEEQDKFRIEVKRYKQRMYELTMKSEKALAAANANAEKKAHTVSPSAEALKPPIIVENAETQTDCDLSASLNKLQGKYNDLINICRYRKNTIKELEEKLARKENSNGNSMSSADSEQMMLKSICESMKKELKLVKEKYENAKVVLHARREEINRLRSKYEQS